MPPALSRPTNSMFWGPLAPSPCASPSVTVIVVPPIVMASGFAFTPLSSKYPGAFRPHVCAGLNVGSV